MSSYKKHPITRLRRHKAIERSQVRRALEKFQLVQEKLYQQKAPKYLAFIGAEMQKQAEAGIPFEKVQRTMNSDFRGLNAMLIESGKTPIKESELKAFYKKMFVASTKKISLFK